MEMAICSKRYFFLDADFLRGTFAPASRACESPIAIACFLLVTFLPERPLFNVPFFRSCIAFSTFSPAFFPYLAKPYLPPTGSYFENLSALFVANLSQTK